MKKFAFSVTALVLGASAGQAKPSKIEPAKAPLAIQYDLAEAPAVSEHRHAAPSGPDAAQGPDRIDRMDVDLRSSVIESVVGRNGPEFAERDRQGALQSGGDAGGGRGPWLS